MDCDDVRLYTDAADCTPAPLLLPDKLPHTGLAECLMKDAPACDYDAVGNSIRTQATCTMPDGSLAPLKLQTSQTLVCCGARHAPDSRASQVVFESPDSLVNDKMPLRVKATDIRRDVSFVFETLNINQGTIPENATAYIEESIRRHDLVGHAWTYTCNSPDANGNPQRITASTKVGRTTLQVRWLRRQVCSDCSAAAQMIVELYENDVTHMVAQKQLLQKAHSVKFSIRLNGGYDWASPEHNRVVIQLALRRKPSAACAELKQHAVPPFAGFLPSFGWSDAGPDGSYRFRVPLELTDAELLFSAPGRVLADLAPQNYWATFPDFQNFTALRINRPCPM